MKVRWLPGLKKSLGCFGFVWVRKKLLLWGILVMTSGLLEQLFLAREHSKHITAPKREDGAKSIFWSTLQMFFEPSRYRCVHINSVRAGSAQGERTIYKLFCGIDTAETKDAQETAAS